MWLSRILGTESEDYHLHLKECYIDSLYFMLVTMVRPRHSGCPLRPRHPDISVTLPLLLLLCNSLCAVHCGLR